MEGHTIYIWELKIVGGPGVGGWSACPPMPTYGCNPLANLIMRFVSLYSLSLLVNEIRAFTNEIRVLTYDIIALTNKIRALANGIRALTNEIREEVERERITTLSVGHTGF